MKKKISDTKKNNLPNENAVRIALAGNPNVGKSTIFNALTGMKQHTGNWTGKTVENAQGYFKANGKNYILTDTPGAYSLESYSEEETVTRDFLLFAEPDMSVVVCDASKLSRTLKLFIEITQINKNAILCVNLIDEAQKDGICVDTSKLSELLGVSVIATDARRKKGISELKNALDNSKACSLNIAYSKKTEELIALVSQKLEQCQLPKRYVAIELLKGNAVLVEKLPFGNGILGEVAEILEKENLTFQNICDEVSEKIALVSKQISKMVITRNEKSRKITTEKIDSVLAGKVFSFPCMLLFMCFIFYITVAFANYPSSFLSELFAKAEEFLYSCISKTASPVWLNDLLLKGAFRTLGWVISVMLPPMAIFFPLFTLLEDWGYLPRIAFNLDRCFKKCSSCGKQSLTMCMGFGCNASGVVGARIISTRRERIMAIVTNSFVPCNGKFPTMITLITVFFVGAYAKSFLVALILAAIIICCVILTLLVTKLLSVTLLKGERSSFILELPPYRRPQIGKTLVRSLFDRTLFVLSRAIIVSVPAGIIIWCLSNIYIADVSIITYISEFLDPIGRLLGLDGVILLAFILGLPANEIVLPIALMAYTSSSSLQESTDILATHALLVENGWTYVTAICFIIFSLFHSPCLTTLLTIKKETGSVKWMIVSALLPTLFGVLLCALVNLIL
ncbi:MAG: ferrous iron transport protein B [Clostridia bacterium]|nr:ferrous iron transport protein B [Clostridia bacterium]